MPPQAGTGSAADPGREWSGESALGSLAQKDSSHCVSKAWQWNHLEEFAENASSWDFPAGPVAKTHTLKAEGLGLIPTAATKT